jgi:hypothetical protein
LLDNPGIMGTQAPLATWAKLHKETQAELKKEWDDAYLDSARRLKAYGRITPAKQRRILAGMGKPATGPKKAANKARKAVSKRPMAKAQ